MAVKGKLAHSVVLTIVSCWDWLITVVGITECFLNQEHTEQFILVIQAKEYWAVEQ